MLYPLSYSRAARQCSKAGCQPGKGCEVPGLPRATKLHKFRACEDTLYRSDRPILSLVRRRHGDGRRTPSTGSKA
jgi:hypothetical protein